MAKLAPTRTSSITRGQRADRPGRSAYREALDLARQTANKAVTPAQSRDTPASLAATANELRGNRLWSEIVNWWTGYGSGGPVSSTNRLDGLDVTRTRWLAVLSPADRGPA